MSYQQQPPYGTPPGPAYGTPPAGGYGAPPIGKTRSPWGVWGLIFITLGIYHLVWYYKINREIRDFARVEVTPGVAVLAVSLGGYLIVPPFVSLANTAGRVRQTQSVAGRNQDCSSGLVILLAILIGLHMPYIQRRLNEVWAAYGAPQV
ncbi:DUF4234 domain-containing protein [Yinghuangia seranimata]|uniref:DUF4234 domain-containing protein n=1 Tax=Yinghuangia seranimata TaxID=408067 RepID=UPI00248B13B8|nr:DUF4234 domain-containing protein [Yinghuangia seranimata]MDI2125171.1 DUF4234 domain-containing protein [Yinghuangia seranimata]